MSTDFIRRERDRIRAGIKRHYQNGQIFRKSTVDNTTVSDGRGGFYTSDVKPESVLLQNATTFETLAKRNVGLDRHLIYVLDVAEEGDVLVLNDEKYKVLETKTDPKGVVTECICENKR